MALLLQRQLDAMLDRQRTQNRCGTAVVSHCSRHLLTNVPTHSMPFWLSSVMVKRYEDLRQDNDELRRALADAERRLAEQRAAAEEARLEASVANKQQEGMAARLEV